MTLASVRTMPIVDAVWRPGYGWRVDLPAGPRLALDEAGARRLVEREAPGSSIRFVREVPRTPDHPVPPTGDGPASRAPRPRPVVASSSRGEAAEPRTDPAGAPAN